MAELIIAFELAATMIPSLFVTWALVSYTFLWFWAEQIVFNDAIAWTVILLVAVLVGLPVLYGTREIVELLKGERQL